MKAAQPNQSLIDGLTVLQAIVSASQATGSRQLARELDLEPTRVNRLARTLASLGMVQQTEARKYEAGPGVHVLAAQSLYASGLIQRAVPILDDLHDTGYTVALGVLWRNQVSYVYHGRTGLQGSDALGTAGLFPAPRSGLGHVLLAEQADVDIAGLSATDAALLRKQLKVVRRQGWARVVRRTRPLAATLAVPVGAPAYAAIGLAGAIRAKDVTPLRKRLTHAAAQIQGH